jgi:hypothetical protein
MQKQNKTIIPSTKAAGTLDTAATLLFAVGCPGNRTAEPDAQFTLNDGGAIFKRI